jgi:hypothetical protein
MFQKKHLIVVHGMGEHTEKTIQDEVVLALNKALNSYESKAAARIQDLVKIIPVAFDDVFEKFRKDRAATAESLLKQLEGVNGARFLGGVVQEIARVEANLGGDEFFDTHWVDVLLYRLTLLNESIRLRTAKKVVDTILAAGGASNVHVLAHSLGTAVLHDALAKTYGPDNLVDESGKALNLNPVTHRLGGIHMIANVSRALQTFIKVGSSIVRPGKLGCVSTFFEYRHKLDPITRIRPFTPTDNGGWVTHNVFVSNYALVEPTAVTRVNVHDLSHYLAIPEVHQKLFAMLIGFVPKKAEKKVAEQKFFDSTVQSKAKALQSTFGNVGTDLNEGAILDLLTTWKQLKDVVVTLGETFK